MPKMKTHKGTKKRVKVTGSGKYIVKHSGTSHIMTKKSNKRKKNLKKDMVVEPGKARKIKTLLVNGPGR